MKKCCTCKQELSEDKFCYNRSTADGLNRNCRKCKSDQARRERERHKDRIARTNKVYYEENREKILEADHEYYLRNKDVIIEKVCQYAKDNRVAHNARGKKAKEKLKLETFTEYCDGSVQCKSCDEEDIEILTVDHIDGNGAEHRREIGLAGRGGYAFYQWLKNNNYPNGFQILCYNCNFRKRNEQLKPKNSTHLQQVRAKYTRGIKLECLDAYGGHECTCGETDIEVLTLDHVNDDGAEHRRKTGTRGNNFYHMLRKNGFPNDPPLQVLCHNCQVKKRQRKYDEERERESRQSNDCNDAAVVT